VRLREEKIKLPVLILGALLPEDIPALFKYDLTPSICDWEFALALQKKAKVLAKPVNAHIKVDTGMGRVGVLPDDAFSFTEKIHGLKFIRVEGIFTHFAFADINRDFTAHQIELFGRLVKRLDKAGMHIPLVHAANSMGMLDYKDGHFNMVRPGLVIYGLYPREDLKTKLKPVLSLKTKVVYVKKVGAGCGISYGHAYITKKPATIATLPIGYGDGFPRNLSNLAPVLIKGKRFRVCGRVCMDQIMVDVGETPVRTGDEAILIGSQAKNKITAEELAELSATIPYEIVCGLGSRIPRVYV
jgi:alanine racemase